MGGKLLWTGLTLILAETLFSLPSIHIVGEIIMVLGLVLLWLDR